MNNGFDSMQAMEWSQINNSSLFAKNWQQAGFDASSAKSWSVNLDADDASKWRSFGFKPEDAKEWRAQGFSAEIAREWFRDGYSLDSVRKWGGCSRKTAISMKRTCPDGLRGWNELVVGNPYETKDKCFRVSGNLMQLLSRSSGLFATYGQFLFFVDFGTGPAPTTSFNSYAKGSGAYKYVDTTGAIRIIPHLKFLANENPRTQTTPKQK